MTGVYAIEAPAIGEIKREKPNILHPEEFFNLEHEVLDQEYLAERYSVFYQQLDSSLFTLRQEINNSELEQDQREYFLHRLAEMGDRVMIDLNGVEGVGGYYEVQEEFIGIPILPALYASPESLRRILSHELNHAVLETKDEGITDSISVELADGLNHGMGYEDEVNEYQQWFGHLSSSEIIGLLHSNHEVVLMNLMRTMVEQYSELDPETTQMIDLKRELNRYWDVLCRLFPRLINKAMGADTADIQVQNSDFEAFWREYQMSFCYAFWGSPERMQGLEG